MRGAASYDSPTGNTMSSARLRPIALATVILGYALLVHYSNLSGAPKALGAALALAPLLAVLMIGAWQARWRWVLIPLLLGGTAALLVASWAQIEQHFGWIYLWQQCAVYAALALAFGRSLLPGRIPLCTRWATIVHGALPEEARRYTRAVTNMWALFFVAVIVASVALYLLASRAAWSLFSNFLVLPLAMVVFAAEYRLRRRALPNMRRATLREMARAYAAESQSLTSLQNPKA
jgi:uncharacterized membrane protein